MAKEVISIECPFCGAKDGIIKEGSKYNCDYCGSEFHINDDETIHRLRQAYNYLITYKFDDADELYRKISREAEENQDYDTYATAEWGRLLASFGVVYVRSFDGNVSVPTFTQYNKFITSVKQSRYYKDIVESEISHESKSKYERMADKLDETYTKIGEEIKKTPEYDVFICVKISMSTEKDPDIKGYTEDGMIARDIYDELTRNGLKVFYSERCCQGIEYDSQILSALTRSKLLLVISTQKDYLESNWVQSEWRRWLNFIKEEEKEKDSLILYLPYFDNEKTRFDLPNILNKKRVQYFTVKNMYNLSHFINNLLKKGETTKEDIHNSKQKNNSTEEKQTEELNELKNKLKEEAERKAKLLEENRKKESEKEKLKEEKQRLEKQVSITHYTSRDYQSIKKEFYLSGNVLEKYYGAGGDIIIPEIVKSIASGAFSNCNTIKSVIIPQSVKSIGNKAFFQCDNLTNVTILDGVTSIGESAFERCKNLNSITIPNSVTNIGKSAFYNCVQLNNIIIPQSVMKMGEYCFSGCTNLKNLTIQEGLVEISEGAFSLCEGLESVEIPNSVIKIGESTFSLCKNLKKVILPGKLKTINDGLFNECCKLINIDIPDSVINIGEDAFNGCYSLTNIVIPDNVINIEMGAFRDCLNLSSIIIPEGVTVIKMNTFADCSNLSSVILSKRLSDIDKHAFLRCRKLKNITLPCDLERIGQEAFYGCTSLTSIIIPKTVKDIGKNVFNKCNMLKSITLPTTLTNLKGRVKPRLLCKVKFY